MENTKWAFSLNEENYTGEFNSKEEAIAEAREELADYNEREREEHDGQTIFWIGKIVYPSVEDHIDTDRILDDIEDSLHDNELGFVDDCDIVEVSDRKAFDKAIKDVIKEYCSTRYWCVEDTEEVTIEESPLEDIYG